MVREAGYATLTVTALMSALSLLAVGYTQFSIAEARKVERVTRQLTIDTALEGAFHQTVYDLQKQRLVISEEHVGQVSFDGYMFEVRFQIENNKLDLNRANPGAALAIFNDILPADYTSQSRRLFQARRSRDELVFETFPVLEAFVDNPDLAACLRDHVTLYRSTAIVEPAFNGKEVQVSDGTILRIMLEHRDESQYRGLDTVVLFTGLEDDPYWILDWQRRDITERGECDRES